MSEQLFDVVFFGILQPGKDKDAVMQNMATLFKTDATRLTPYFAGGRKVIKGKISAAAAEKYKAALENVGLVINIEELQASDTDAQAGSAGQADSQSGAENSTEQSAAIDTSDMSVAPAGVDVIENPVEVPPQKIDDISAITLAEAGADVIENPIEKPVQTIGDISDLSIAEVGSDVLEHPPQIATPEIDIPDIDLAEIGADLVENPKPEVKADIPDTSELSLD